MIALDSETVGYDLTGRSIKYGDYFDKQCFCGAFAIDVKTEPYSGTGTMGLTKERLWMNATCGPTSLPHNWTDALKTTEFAYIPIEDWHWPECVTDMPEQVTELTGQCATGAYNWRQLAATTTLDMISWQWTLKPSNDSSLAPIGSIETMKTCAKTEWKLGSLAMVNIATFLSACLARRTGMHRIARGFLWQPDPESTLLLGEQPSKAMNLSPAASSLFAEAILQVSSSYYMMMTVNYGREHNFYLEDMKRLERAPPAKSMYIGAFLWHITAILAFVSLMALFNQYWTWLEDKRAHQWVDKSKSLEEALRSEGGYYTAYGTLPIEGQNNRLPQKSFLRLYTVSIIGMLLLWIAQWLFWYGLIGLRLEEFCPPKLGALIAVWIASSLAGATLGAIQ
ncbi:uncharacterized protein Z519_08050 [Cladophialophora bantiana CBS 173.52]|uniref:Uncharacterized protein n=1 Tax=Cladophialophora bantiana (strain ATCC 10958 / CBS 173.52 / CDC B-1940 / NIH 8579) TaxID=1442370 RepID=A0A0D2HK76_CLAB1|nr:uncharacterized protein Z519_08050 [Cladophialophora bantiana CBS 173.52]KIW91155.1 hypothetical protein Z519_08050 [Cladophialophora bantiana CBS 173.52]